ncbi:glycosyltransferase family 4 protein, partial [Proteus mirabilis]
NEIYPLQISKKILSFNDISNIFKCDICHISGVSFIGLLIGLICKLLRKKITFTMHGTLKIEKNFRRIRAYRLLIELLLTKLSDRIFTVSNNLREQVSLVYNHAEKKIISIPNGVNLYEIKKTAKVPGSIVCIGGGRKEKRVLDVCRAVHILNKEGNNITIKVFGEDSLDTNLIKEYTFVDYYSFVPQEVLLESLASTQIFVQYSDYEPFSLSIFDAIQLKCNIVASNKVGALDYLQKSDLEKISIASNFEELLDGLRKQLSFIDRDYLPYNYLSWENIFKLYKKEWTKLKKNL